MLEEFELWAAMEREADKDVEEELLMYKKEVMEQHEKGFNKVIRQVRFFVKDLDLGLFHPFKDGVLLDEEDIAAEEEAGEEQGAEEQGNDATIQASFVYFLLFFVVGFWPHRPCNYDNLFFFF